ncbi:hypothetical Protein YC6258_05286 [Gynuella sunshinyii YC6258]|uniref:Uncharacterized protein n=1 Tax=Gynuella sunshinyii YC6258 TaxID=1445510 RepID=A0A0C5VRR4_9GAMM|nr:hypothetical Protein YC6258_05286 [Gynuella sunshinyii YC6258]
MIDNSLAPDKPDRNTCDSTHRLNGLFPQRSIHRSRDLLSHSSAPAILLLFCNLFRDCTQKNSEIHSISEISL